MEKELPVVRISVRSLVEFIMREGDIDNRTSGGMNLEAMQLGGKIHRKIQRRMGDKYHAEVSLKYQIPMECFILSVEGRADGIIEEAKSEIIDEIKGTFLELEYLTKPVNVHLAQAKCYAYIWAKQREKEEIGVQMTYCQMETEEIKRFRYQFRFEELSTWFMNLVLQYEKWARFQIEWKAVRNASIQQIQFPFPYREGQRELVVAVYRSILRKKRLFIEAPTGVGKTISTVFPAVKAVGEELGEKIFYLTAKTITRTVAEHAIEVLREQKLRMKVITLTAKEKICFCETPECNPESCPYAKGHFDRVNDAVYDLLMTTDKMTKAKIEEQAKRYKVCPFELALDVSSWVDMVICDYNYVFDPNVHLKRFFSESASGEYIFLIDEAHNLVERGRNMYSAELYKEDFLELKKLIKDENKKLCKCLEACNKIFLEWKKQCETYQRVEDISQMYLKLLRTTGEMEKYLEECVKKELQDAVRSLYFSIRHFMNIYEKIDDNYEIYSEFQNNGKFMLKLFCMNPAQKLREYMDKGNSTIFFSATLLPIRYYKTLLSGEMEDYAVYAESVFRQENRLLLSGIDVSTKYSMRGREMYQKYAQYILRVSMEKTGNYLAFFPSYSFMEEVYDVFQKLCLEEEILIDSILQAQYMNEEARTIFLENFEEKRECSLVGFCVLGGVFSEGIDLTEEKLIGVFVAGTGIPQICSEREILKQYFEQQGENGFDYAYRYPGMNKVLQAAGRVIRTEDDKGIILLLDERFQEKQCRGIFPKEWSDCMWCNQEQVLQRVEGFWLKEEKIREEH